MAMAEREHCEMVSADDKLLRNVLSRFPVVISLNSLP